MSTCANSSMLQLQSHDSSLRAVGAPNLCVVPAAGSSDGGLALGAKHAYLLSHLILKLIILPRQARDKHGEKHSKERDAFFAGTKDCVRFDMGWLYNGKMKSGGKCLTNKGGRLSLETCCISHCGADRCGNGAWF